jgi:hypothetical protein
VTFAEFQTAGLQSVVRAGVQTLAATNATLEKNFLWYTAGRSNERVVLICESTQCTNGQETEYPGNTQEHDLEKTAAFSGEFRYNSCDGWIGNPVVQAKRNSTIGTMAFAFQTGNTAGKRNRDIFRWNRSKWA